jgi:hypothetical protein
MKCAFKGSLGTHSSLMLALPPPLTQRCAVMTLGEGLDRRLQSTSCALWKGEGTLDRDAHKILGMLHKKMWA